MNKLDKFFITLIIIILIGGGFFGVADYYWEKANHIKNRPDCEFIESDNMTLSEWMKAYMNYNLTKSQKDSITHDSIMCEKLSLGLMKFK